jgi:hypothetical protein
MYFGASIGPEASSVGCRYTVSVGLWLIRDSQFPRTPLETSSMTVISLGALVAGAVLLIVIIGVVATVVLTTTKRK